MNVSGLDDLTNKCRACQRPFGNDNVHVLVGLASLSTIAGFGTVAVDLFRGRGDPSAWTLLGGIMLTTGFWIYQYATMLSVARAGIVCQDSLHLAVQFRDEANGILQQHGFDPNNKK